MKDKPYIHKGLPSDLLDSEDEGRRRLKTVTHLSDRLGRSAKISQKGELLTGGNVDDVDVNFQYNIRTAEVNVIETGTGSVSHPGASGSYAELSPGTGIGFAGIVSKAPVRYRGGHEVYAEQSMIFRVAEANLNQFIGFYNDTDRLGYYFQGLDFGILLREGGNDTFVAQADFNIDRLDGTGPSKYAIDPTKINVVRPAFVWHGGLPLTLEIQVGQSWWPVHVFDFSNTIDETHLENPHLPVGAFVERVSGTGTADAAKTASWRGGSIASAVDEPSDDWTGSFILDVPLASGSGTRTNILTFENPATWRGKQNHIVYELGVVTFRSGANKDLAIVGITNATLAGANPASAIDDENYALRVITGGTITAGVSNPATILGAGERERIDVRGTGIKIFPGDTFTIGTDPGNSSANGTFSAAARLIHEA